jgi:4,5-DOPA dioxygenase extradiol
MLSGSERPETIYDFSGFPRQLYDVKYPAPGDPTLANEIVGVFAENGIKSKIDRERGFDHGAWVPLCLMFPDADIPTIQLSIQGDLSAEHHYNLGKALSPLKNEGVLIVGSGGATHNLGDIHGRKMKDEPVEYALKFDAWLENAIVSGNTDAILNYGKTAPEAERNHPFPAEHFLPLFPPLGAAGDGAKGKLLHKDFIYGILSLAAYMWD